MLETMARRSTKSEPAAEQPQEGKLKRIVTDVSPDTYQRLLTYIKKQTFTPSVADVLRVALDRLLDEDEKKG